MRDVEPPAARWRKSSHSGGQSGQCVEVAGAADVIGIRDSKNPAGPRLAVGRAAFRGLVEQVKAGHLDYPARADAS